MKNDKAKLKMTPVLLVFPVIFLLVTAFAFPQFALAQTFTCDAGSTVDADKDGVPAPGGPLYSQISPCSDNYPDCNDNDPWSHRYGSKDIASVKVEYAPAYVTKTQTEKKFTPDSKKFNPLLGNLLVTVTFKAKKCGVTANSIFMPMKVYYTTKDSSGNEVSIGLQLLADTGSITASDNLVRVSDLVYRGSIPGINFLTSDIEPYIASVAAGRPVQLKFVGPDIGPNKDTPKYQPLPMTNCAQVYGGGKYKNVFMRGQSSKAPADGFIREIDRVRQSGFQSIEPFKSYTYRNQFSFYTDLQNHNDKQWVDLSALIYKGGGDSAAQSYYKEITDTSNCKLGRQYFIYMDIVDLNSEGLLAFTKPHSPLIILGIRYPETAPAQFPHVVAIHELGHALAGLADEYFEPGVPAISFFGFEETIATLKKKGLGTNCVLDPKTEYTYDNKLWGGVNYIGCLFEKVVTSAPKIVDGDVRYDSIPIFRPSSVSIMSNKIDKEKRFDVVSCGHILKAINDSPTAKQHFPECAAMAAKDGSIIPVGQ